MLITDLGREVIPARASDPKISAKVRPPAPIPKAPILRKLRRETPSQYRLLGPKMVNMTTPLVGRQAGLATACLRRHPLVPERHSNRKRRRMQFHLQLYPHLWDWPCQNRRTIQ